MLHKIESWPEYKLAAALTVALRVFYSLVAAVLAFMVHPDPAAVHSNMLTENLPAPGTLYYAFLGIWERFDTLWYLRIAQAGYDHQRAVIFYPLYPTVIRLFSWGMPATAAALLISTVAAFFSLCGLLRLGRDSLSSMGRLRTLLLFCAWPGSFMLFAGYAESLTLALIVWSVVFARGGHWGFATACGFAAGLSRPSGVLVVVPLAVLALRSASLRSTIVLLTPAGLAGYWGWLRWSGRMSVVESYRHQGVSFAPPWMGVADAVRHISIDHDAFLAIKLGLVVLFAALSLRREVRIEDKIFAVAVIVQVFLYTGHPLFAATRYLLLVYPAFFVLGAYATRRLSWPRFSFYFAASGFLNLVWMGAFLDWRMVI